MKFYKFENSIRTRYSIEILEVKQRLLFARIKKVEQSSEPFLVTASRDEPFFIHYECKSHVTSSIRGIKKKGRMSLSRAGGSNVVIGRARARLYFRRWYTRWRVIVISWAPVGALSRLALKHLGCDRLMGDPRVRTISAELPSIGKWSFTTVFCTRVNGLDGRRYIITIFLNPCRWKNLLVQNHKVFGWKIVAKIISATLRFDETSLLEFRHRSTFEWPSVPLWYRECGNFKLWISFSRNIKI